MIERPRIIFLALPLCSGLCVLITTNSCSHSPAHAQSRAPRPKIQQPAKVTTTMSASKGLSLIKAHQCLSCHTMDGKGAKDGVSLDNLQRKKDFIIQHLLDPEASVAGNPAAFKGDPNMMPDHQLSKQEAKFIADYLLQRNQAKKQTTKPAGKSK